MSKKIKTTERGFRFVEFKDRNDVTCSIQESSIATEACIWIGCDDADPQYFIPHGNPSWKKLEVPKDTIFNTRMHLTQQE